MARCFMSLLLFLKGRIKLKKKIESLLKTLNESPDTTFAEMASKLVTNAIKDFGDYFHRVVEMEAEIQQARFRMEDDNLRDFIARLDNGRRIAHEACLSDITIVNRVSIKVLGKPIFDIEGLDRTQIADLVIMPCAKEYFDERKK